MASRPGYKKKPGGEPKQGLRPTKKTGKPVAHVGPEKDTPVKMAKMTRKPVAR